MTEVHTRVLENQSGTTKIENIKVFKKEDQDLETNESSFFLCPAKRDTGDNCPRVLSDKSHNSSLGELRRQIKKVICGHF